MTTIRSSSAPISLWPLLTDRPIQCVHDAVGVSVPEFCHRVDFPGSPRKVRRFGPIAGMTMRSCDGVIVGWRKWNRGINRLGNRLSNKGRGDWLIGDALNIALLAAERTRQSHSHDFAGSRRRDAPRPPILVWMPRKLKHNQYYCYDHLNIMRFNSRGNQQVAVTPDRSWIMFTPWVKPEKILHHIKELESRVGNQTTFGISAW
jgi:hypothetical protein